jgi:hypothetical protein
MEEWFVPKHMIQWANRTTRFFGYDQQGNVPYQFDNLGFRTGDTSGSLSINLIGNSVSFGIGLPFDQTFGAMVANNLNKKLRNYSFGCYSHENHDHLTNLKNLVAQDNNDIYVVQINNLDRRRMDQDTVVTGNEFNFCKRQFLDYFDQVTDLLKHKPTMFLYWDNIEFNLPKSVTDQILIFNKFFLDNSLPDNKDTFGPKSHQVIAKILTLKLAEFN